MAYAKIRPRRGTLYEWSTVNPILFEGELALEYPDTGVGTGLCRFKIGDGVNPYTSLPYAFDGASAASINGGSVSVSHTIQLRSGTSEEWQVADPILKANEIGYDTTMNCVKIGDGEKSWNELSYMSSYWQYSGEYDFGSEDPRPEDDPLHGLGGI